MLVTTNSADFERNFMRELQQRIQRYRDGLPYVKDADMFSLYKTLLDAPDAQDWDQLTAHYRKKLCLP